MNWVEELNRTKLTIVTGDGKTYSPLWSLAPKKYGFNIAEFEFDKIRGTRVERGESKGNTYDLVIAFQGDDHVAKAKEFEQSSYDKRHWVVTHPVYGKMNLHPSEIEIDPTGLNVTRISIVLLETILDGNPKATISDKDFILQSKGISDELFAVNFASDVKPTSANISTMTVNNTRNFNLNKLNISDSVEYEEFMNYYNEANSYVLDATNEPKLAMQKTQNFLNYPPSLISQPVKIRINTLKSQFEGLVNDINALKSFNDKKIFESTASTVISSMTVAAVNPQSNDYQGRPMVLGIITDIINTYNTFISTLDELQDIDGTDVDSYIPDPNGLVQLNKLVNYTVANLFNIAIGAKQERSIYLEDDSNVIILAHRFYGLLADDSTIDKIMNENSYGPKNVFSIEKGTKVIYYV